tara:strand:+ start:693 stop:1085 length:393 start_codon:yes stop_codon:yes gene_type:complete
MKNKQFMQIFYQFFDEKLAPLSPNAITGYLHLRRRFDGKNNGAIPFSCRELADSLGKSKSTAKNIFDELLDRGLVNIAKDSDFNVKYKIARLWTINGLKNKKSVQYNGQSVQQDNQVLLKHREHGAENGS